MQEFMQSARPGRQAVRETHHGLPRGLHGRVFVIPGREWAVARSRRSAPREIVARHSAERWQAFMRRVSHRLPERRIDLIPPC